MNVTELLDDCLIKNKSGTKISKQAKPSSNKKKIDSSDILFLQHKTLSDSIQNNSLLFSKQNSGTPRAQLYSEIHDRR